MNSKKLTGSFVFLAMSIAFILSGCASTNSDNLKSIEDTISSDSENTIQLKEAKLIIEHNDKYKDTRFQSFIDSEGWSDIRVAGPEGKILTFGGEGKLGLTELFFETVEPENKDKSIPDMLKVLP